MKRLLRLVLVILGAFGLAGCTVQGGIYPPTVHYSPAPSYYYVPPPPPLRWYNLPPDHWRNRHHERRRDRGHWR